MNVEYFQTALNFTAEVTFKATQRTILVHQLVSRGLPDNTPEPRLITLPDHTFIVNFTPGRDIGETPLFRFMENGFRMCMKINEEYFNCSGFVEARDFQFVCLGDVVSGATPTDIVNAAVERFWTTYFFGPVYSIQPDDIINPFWRNKRPTTEQNIQEILNQLNKNEH